MTATLTPPPDVVALLEEALELDNPPRLMCQLFIGDLAVLEPRIVPWKGWEVDHSWDWLSVKDSVSVNGWRASILDQVDGAYWVSDVEPFPLARVRRGDNLVVIGAIAKGARPC